MVIGTDTVNYDNEDWDLLWLGRDTYRLSRTDVTALPRWYRAAENGPSNTTSYSLSASNGSQLFVIGGRRARRGDPVYPYYYVNQPGGSFPFGLAFGSGIALPQTMTGIQGLTFFRNHLYMADNATASTYLLNQGTGAQTRMGAYGTSATVRTIFGVGHNLYAADADRLYELKRSPPPFVIWGAPTYNQQTRAISALAIFDSEPSDFEQQDFSVEKEGAANVWTTDSNWLITSTEGTTSRTITATPNPNVIQGNYRITVREDAFGHDRPPAPQSTARVAVTDSRLPISVTSFRTIQQIDRHDVQKVNSLNYQITFNDPVSTEHLSADNFESNLEGITFGMFMPNTGSATTHSFTTYLPDRTAGDLTLTLKANAIPGSATHKPGPVQPVDSNIIRYDRRRIASLTWGTPTYFNNYLRARLTVHGADVTRIEQQAFNVTPLVAHAAQVPWTIATPEIFGDQVIRDGQSLVIKAYTRKSVNQHQYRIEVLPYHLVSDYGPNIPNVPSTAITSAPVTVNRAINLPDLNSYIPVSSAIGPGWLHVFAIDEGSDGNYRGAYTFWYVRWSGQTRIRNSETISGVTGDVLLAYYTYNSLGIRFDIVDAEPDDYGTYRVITPGWGARLIPHLTVGPSPHSVRFQPGAWSIPVSELIPPENYQGSFRIRRNVIYDDFYERYAVFSEPIEHRVHIPDQLPNFQLPSIRGIPDVTVFERTSHQIHVNMDGNPFPTLAITNPADIPSGMYVQGTTIFIPSSVTVNHDTEYTVEVEARSNQGTASASFTLTILNQVELPVIPETRPSIGPVADIHLFQGESAHIPLLIGGNPFPEVTINSALANIVQVDQTVTLVVPNTIDVRAGQTISERPVITARNKIGTATTNFQLQVTDPNTTNERVPVITAISDFSVNEDTAHSTQINVSGNPAPTLTIANASSLPDQFSIQDNQFLIAAGLEVDSDTTYSVRLVATNSRGATTTTFNVTIDNVVPTPGLTTPPTIQAVDPVTVTEGTSHVVNLVVGGNPTPALRIAGPSNLPAAISLSGNQLLIPSSITIDATTTWRVVITADSSAGRGLVSFDLTIRDRETEAFALPTFGIILQSQSWRIRQLQSLLTSAVIQYQ